MPTASPEEQKRSFQHNFIYSQGQRKLWRGENYSKTGLVEKQKMQKIIGEVQRCSQVDYVAAPLKKA